MKHERRQRGALWRAILAAFLVFGFSAGAESCAQAHDAKHGGVAAHQHHAARAAKSLLPARKKLHHGHRFAKRGKVTGEVFFRALGKAKLNVTYPHLEEITILGDHQITKAGAGNGLFPDADRALGMGLEGAQGAAIAAGRTLARVNPVVVAARIKADAIKLGMGLRMPFLVWRTEGRGGYVGDHGTSFGPFQFHFGKHGSGLGWRFKAETGLDARDPATVLQQIDFAMEWAAKYGWHRDWYGYQHAHHHHHHRHWAHLS